MPTPRELANAVRALSMDAVQSARSGHPGMPMGMADIAQVLWTQVMRHDPQAPQWPNRDRFVLSNGHGSMLLYSVLHLTGYDVSMDDLRGFRQLGSATPGHPEVGDTPGVETTTGPLGQGLANAVGMALAEHMLASRFNRPGHTVIDHSTYVFVGDGCLMEGISHEAASLAGTLGLGKLIVMYDDNGISIDGAVEGWFTDDTPKRFEAYDWHVVRDVDGHDSNAIAAAIEAGRANANQPTLVCCKTTIGFGSPNKEGKESSHGAPLGDDEIALTRDALGWPHAPFEVPADIYAGWDMRQRGASVRADWDSAMAAYRTDHPELAAELERRASGELPADWASVMDGLVDDVQANAESIASRNASRNALNLIGPLLPELAGGSADLAGSNLTIWAGSQKVSAENGDGNYIYYGVREFGMAAISNGLALHGGIIPYAATFLMFSEYSRNALRMAALMGARVIHVFTHDSIGLGEDGPTHQAVEQAATLRLMPNMHVWRPCDAVESLVSWRCAIERTDGPASLLFSRQGLPHQERDSAQVTDIARGGYILFEPAEAPVAVLIATGSEVGLARKAADELNSIGTPVRVVSMPCVEVYDAQDAAYKERVLPGALRARVAIEAGVSDGWYRMVGLDGAVVGLDTFGESGPAGEVFEHFGFTADNVVKTVRGVLRAGA
jgi:transketolase